MSTTFYPTLPADHFIGERAVQNVPPGQPILISAASFETISRRRKKPGEIFTPEIPEHIPEIAVDPGGFIAHLKGGYRFTWETYVDWLFTLGPRVSWAALPDLPCESELASDAYKVRARQETTLEYAHDVWGTVFDQPGRIDDTEGFEYRIDFPWSWVATVQGRHIDEYVWMAEQLKPLLALQRSDYWEYANDPPIVREADFDDKNVVLALPRAIHGTLHWRVAIGSLCKRKDMVEACKIVQAVVEVLPHEQFHLWGIDQRLIPLLQRAGLIDHVASFDTSAYNGRFRKGIRKVDAERKRLGLSQRTHADSILLPRYAKRVDGRLAQQTLFSGSNRNVD